MNKIKVFKSVVASALCLAMVLSIILGALFLMPPTETQAASMAGNNFDFDFKKDDGSKVSISFLGDSITTYMGVSNNTDYNSTIGGNAVYYGRTNHDNYLEFQDVKQKDTWWQQAIDTLDMELCVNNSWSGSKIINMTDNKSDAISGQNNSGFYRRCQQLHNKNGKNPDIVVVFLGTNDCGSRQSVYTSGGSNTMYGTNTLRSVDKNYMSDTWLPGTVVGAYGGMIRRICAAYPNAEIYCCTLLPQEDERYSDNKAVYDVFNAGVKEIVDGLNTGNYTDQSGNKGTCYKHIPGVYMVDFYNDSGIHQDKQSRENCYANRLHPNKNGMDAMTNCLISELMEHSKYMGSNKGATVDVTYDLANTYVEVGNVTSSGEKLYGDVTRAVKYQPFQVELNAKGDPNIVYKVMMGGNDITNQVVYDNVISIPSVTGAIEITAHEFDSYHWVASKDGLVSKPNSGAFINDNKLTQFYPGGTCTYDDKKGVVTFDKVGQAFKLAEPINLLHDRDWSMEFKMSGTFGSGVMLFSYLTISMDYNLNKGTKEYHRENNMYVFRTETSGMFAIGVATQRDNSNDSYKNYGIGLTNTSFGGTANFDVNAMHTYRMFNVYDRTTGKNKIYLSVDNGTPLEMKYYAVGPDFMTSNPTSEVESYNRDITFNAMGTWNAGQNEDGYGHPLRNCSIEYIKVYENGSPASNDYEINNYYWEFQSGSAPVSNPDSPQYQTGDGSWNTSVFTDNPLTVTQGVYNNGGLLGNTTSNGDLQLKLTEPAQLMANRPWILEYKTKANTSATQAGGILFTSDSSASNVFGNVYIHITQEDILLGYYGRATNAYTNNGISYATIASTVGSSSGYNFRKEGHTYRLENVINADGTNVIKLTVDGKAIGNLFASNSNWVGRDLIVNYFGSTNHPLQNIDLEYILIYENGIPTVTEDPIDNYRWEGKAEGMTSVEGDDYFSYNKSTLMMGSGPYGVHEFPSYYKLSRSVVLQHDRNWNVEWRASGSWGGTDSNGDDPMLFSSSKTPRKNMTYIWRNSNDLIVMGYWTGAGYKNYGIHVPSTSFGALKDDQMYTYRLENVVTRKNGAYSSNEVVLYIDDVKIGVMNNYFLNGNVNGNDQGTTDNWISGKDFIFDYIANDKFSLLDVNFEYIQVWEDGYKYDNSRLEYLIANQEARYEGVTTESWNNYQAAINAGREAMKLVNTTQSVIDAAVDEIISARNQLVIPCNETKIYSTELVTGEYARIGKQIGVKVITSPDVAQVGAEVKKHSELYVDSSKIQTMIIDGKETVVKVWVISWTYGKVDAYYTWTIGVWKEFDPNHYIGNDNSANDFDEYVDMSIPLSTRFITGISITTDPTKTVYSMHERFDPTGMVVVATYNKPDSEGSYTAELNLEDIAVENPVVSDTNKRIYITYQGARAYIDVDVQLEKTALDVSDIKDANLGDFVSIEGYFVGYGYENYMSELWVKDLQTSDLISIKMADYGDLSEYFAQFQIGNIIDVSGYVMDDSSYDYFSMNKRHISITSINAIQIVDSSTPSISYSNATFNKITDWETMKSSIQIDTWEYLNTTPAYGYYEFTGKMYLVPVWSDDGSSVRFMLHMNQSYYDDTSELYGEYWNGCWQSYIISDDMVGGGVFETRLRDACDNSEYVSGMYLTFDDYVNNGISSFEFTGTIRAAFIVGNEGQLELSVLDSSWINIDADSIVVPHDFGELEEVG